MSEISCLYCEKPFKQSRSDQKFCSVNHRVLYFTQKQKEDAKRFREGGNFPPDYREKFIENELERIIGYLCWWHGYERNHPYIKGIIRAVHTDVKFSETIDKDEYGQFPMRNCRQCQRQFRPRKQWDWYCTSNCSEEAHVKNMEYRNAKA